MGVWTFLCFFSEKIYKLLATPFRENLFGGINMISIMHLIVHRHAKLRVHRLRHKLKSKELGKELDALHRELKRLNIKMKELDAAING